MISVKRLSLGVGRRAKRTFRRAFAPVRARINYNKMITLGDRQFRVPVQGGLEMRIDETWMRDLLAELQIGTTGAFVDVGVNLGQTLLAAKSIDPQLTYVGFEPNVTCAAYVRQLVELNGLKGCSLLPVALFDQSRVLRLNSINDGKADSCATVVEDFRPDRRVVESHVILGIDVNSVDGVLDETVGLIKIDVEGAELAVLRSLRAVIVRDKPQIVLEILPAYSEDNTMRVQNNADIEALCDDLQYDIYRVVKEPSIAFTKIDEIGIHGDLGACDYVLRPRGGDLPSDVSPT